MQTELLQQPAKTALAVTSDSMRSGIVAELKRDADFIDSIVLAYAPQMSELIAVWDECTAVADDQPKAARAARLKIRAIRLATDKLRVSLNEDSDLRKKAVQKGFHYIVTDHLAPEEARLQAIEDAEERREEAKKDALAAGRAAEFEALGFDVTGYNFRDMPAGMYADMLAGKKALKAQREREAAEAETARIAAEAKAAEEKAAAEKLAAEQKAALDADNLRLVAEAEAARAAAVEVERLAQIERDAAAERERAAQAEADRKAQEVANELARVEAAARVERDAAAAALAEVQAKAAAEKKAADDAAAVAKAEADQKAAEQQAEIDRLAKVTADAEAEADRAEAARVAAAKKAAAAPDKEKLIAFAASLRALPTPELATQPKMRDKMNFEIEALAQRCEVAAESL